MYQSQVHDVEELLDIWHDLQQSAVDRERVFSHAYEPKEDILSSDNTLIIKWAVIEAAKQCFKLVECVFQIS